MRILFYANYSKLGPSSRYRLYNYAPEYEKAGIHFRMLKFWGDFYLKRVIPEKSRLMKLLYLSFYYPFCIIRRFSGIMAAPFYDLVHIERDFCPGLPPVGEFIITKVFRKKLIFEFDDAVYLSDRPRGKTAKVLKRASGVIAGNEVLAGFARNYCSNVIVVPTSIDLEKYDRYRFDVHKEEDSFTIGWIGTITTIQYLDIVKEVLWKLAKSYDIRLHVVCNKRLDWGNGVKIRNIQWKLDTYIEEISRFDIGIMPLHNSEWENGKCGFKLIQYMGVGIPVVASPVGVNTKLVIHSQNGYLAGNDEEWYDVLEKLIQDRNLRKAMGMNGRRLVEEHYSTRANAPALMDFFQKTLS